jgi:hypothetical protein
MQIRFDFIGGLHLVREWAGLDGFDSCPGVKLVM